MASPNVLLTGAGFTANWKGFLKYEMWSQIFNQKTVQNNRKIRALLFENFAFEHALDVVRDNGVYSNEDRGSIWSAVNIAFDRLERYSTQAAEEPANHADMAAKFIKDVFNGEQGFFFTLNQDLFVERHLFSAISLRPLIEPVNKYPIQGASVDQWRFTVPKKEDILANGPASLTQVTTDQIRYIKLHGSLDWRSDWGLHVWVIGGGKRDAIEREPILQFYFNTFRDVLNRSQKLLVIGYGFRDDHINEVIIEAAEKHGLRIYIISPDSPDDFKANSLPAPQRNRIWKSLAGYYPYKFRDVYMDNRRSKELTTSLVFD